MAPIDMDRALTFGERAEAYARWRPGYPEPAVAWLAPNRPARVADVGAGTGLLTAALVRRGLSVAAVEPDPRMLAVLRREVPAAAAHLGSSDALPFEDHSLDAVLVADAWHWFPMEATMVEVRRVLRPGGWLSLVWNVVAPVESWEFEVAGIDPDKKGVSEEARPSSPFPGEELETARFPWDWEITPDHYVAQLATNSAVIAMSETERSERLHAALAVLQQARDMRGTPTLPFHHVATCMRWTPACSNVRDCPA